MHPKVIWVLIEIVSETDVILNTLSIEDARDLPIHWVECISFNVGWFVSLAIAEEFRQDYAESLRC